MDLRNLSSTPNQLDVQRRPSLGSLSSTSGYASSGYGGPVNGGSAGTSANGGHVNGGNNSQRTQRPVTNAWINNETTIHDVTPWVEQQKQQQSKVGSFDLDKEKKSELSSKTSGSSGPQPSISTIKTNESLDDSHSDDKDTDSLDEDDDDLIPTAIVIKNIPFAIKKEQLLDVMTKLNLPLPYAFNYHFDNGVFRGLAFANFTSTDETSSVVNLLNGREIGGRKLRVEYKKMLPAQERERIEREKREKRGQLEEQHRSASNASLASLISATSTTAATKNLSVNGGATSNQERVFLTYPNSTNSTLPSLPNDVNFNDGETLELFSQLLIFKDDNSKAILELAYPPNLNMNQRKLISSLCNYLNLLELYDNGLIIIRRKPGQVFQLLTNSSSQPTNTPMEPAPHSSSMMNLNQLNGAPLPINNGLSSTHPELLRSHSQSALPLPRLRQQQNGTPIPHQFPQYQGPNSAGSNSNPPSSAINSNKPLYSNIQPFAMYPQNSGSNILPQNLNSNAALLRNGSRPYDIRSTPPLTNTFTSPNQTHSSTSGNTNGASASTTSSGTASGSGNGGSTPTGNNATLNSSGNSPTPQPHSSLFKNGPSQPSTPLTSGDINSRFAPFGQHSQLTGSLSSLPATAANGQSRHSDDFINDMQAKFTSMDLYGNSSGSGIWGPK